MKERLERLESEHAKPWYVNDKSIVQIGNIDFVNFLNTELGFYNAILHGNLCIVRVSNKVIEEIEDKTVITQTALKWLDEYFDSKIEEDVYKITVKGKWLNKAKLLLSDSTLSFLPILDINLHTDTKDTATFYYANTTIQITSDQISILPYSVIDGYILKEQITPRDFNLPKCEDVFSTPFAQFTYNISNQEDERFVPFMTLIGYMLHRYQDPSNMRIAILLDGSINELDDSLSGGVGKGVVIQALDKMRSLCDIDGKEYKNSNTFKNQRVTPTTSIVCINDVSAHQNLVDFYGITEGFTINRKYKPEIRIPRDRSPKLILTTNYVIKAPSGNSTERRKTEFEFSTHYGEHRNIFDDFGQNFFQDWSDEQWNEFTFFMLCCVQLYLQKGLVEAPSINLVERRLINEVGLEYIDFFDEVLQTKTKLHKKELFKEFISGGYVESRRRPTQRTFTIRFKKYLGYKSIPYKETPSNSKVFFEIITEGAEETLLTIEDIHTDYKVIDTPNKMTRLVSKMTKHFEDNPDEVLAVDLETTGLDCFQDAIVCMSLTFKKRTGYNIVFPKQKAKAVAFIQPLLPFLKAEHITKVFHNAKFDLKFLKQYGIPVLGRIEDTMILDHFLDPNRKKHGLKEISELHLGYKQISFKQLLGDKLITEIPVEELTRYVCEDTDLTFQLYHFITNKLKQ